MPNYRYLCEGGHEFSRDLPMREHDVTQTCDCGALAAKLPSAPRIWRKPSISYQSPVDGRPVTSEAERREDMARNNCMEYDPGMMTDYARRGSDSEADLERALDSAVEREVAALPGDKLEKLANELGAGATAEPVRLTAGLKPMKVGVKHGK